MKEATLRAALVLTLAGCAGTADTDTEEVGAADPALAIEDPVEDPGPGGDPGTGFNDGTPCNLPSVVYMSRGDGAACSGILIGPQAVLTAAHCLHDNGEMVPVEGISFGTGGVACTQGDADAVAYMIHPQYDDAIHLSETDLAVVRLSNPIPGATYTLFSVTTPHIGDTVTTVGFGPSPTQPGLGTQRCQTARVTGVAAHLITTDRNVCGGDSGGPVLDATGRLLGTIGGTDSVDCGPSQPGHSYAGHDRGFVIDALGFFNEPGASDCTPGTVIQCRPAGGACFDDTTIVSEQACHLGARSCQSNSQWGACEGFVGPSAETCNEADDDCDGDIDEGCPQVCGDGLCNGGEWWQTCPADCEPPIQCPPGRHPVHVGGTGFTCVCDYVFCPGVQNPDTCECMAAQTCGNGACEPGEVGICSADCGACGDGFCSVHEDDWSCPIDCHTCGDGWCDFGEDEWSCPSDCGGGSSCICGWDCPSNTPGCGGFCGDGDCDLITENSTTCPADCSLGGGDDPGGYCYDELYWWAWAEMYGWEDAVAAYDWYCGAW